MTDLLDAGLRGWHRRDDIERLLTLIKPAWKLLAPALPEAIPLFTSLLHDILPDTAPIPKAGIIMTFDAFWLQRSLNQAGSGITVDGDIGPETETAIRDFRLRSNLPAEGPVVETIGHLILALEKKV